MRQRRRLGRLLAALDDSQWAAPSRCVGWAVRDVVGHIDIVNQFWSFSIASGLSGSPTRVLEGFDPAATPAAMAKDLEDVPASELLARYEASTEALASTICGLDADQLAMLAEAPPGHIAVRDVVLHALWDGWVHERDIVLPLRGAPTIEPDEVRGALLYAAALGAAFAATSGSGRIGAMAIVPTDLVDPFVVEIAEAVVVRPGAARRGAAELGGTAVELVESLSCRADEPSLSTSDRWMTDGLREAFDLA